MAREKTDCSIGTSAGRSILTHMAQSNQSIVTLRDLKNVVHTTEGKPLPSDKQLRENGKLLMTQLLYDGRLDMYYSGFAVYRSGKHTAVLRIDRVSYHTYEFSTTDKTVTLDDQPWATALMLCGEKRIEDQVEDRNQRRHVACMDDYYDAEEQGSAVVLVSTDDVEQIVLDRNDDMVAQMLSGLTARQRQVVEMYYVQGMTQQAIADELGIAHQVVDRLRQSGHLQARTPRQG